MRQGVCFTWPVCCSESISTQNVSHHILNFAIVAFNWNSVPAQLKWGHHLLCGACAFCMHESWKSTSSQLERVWGVRLVSMPCLYRWRNVCTHAYILYMHIYRWKTAEKNQISFYGVKQAPVSEDSLLYWFILISISLLL